MKAGASTVASPPATQSNGPMDTADTTRPWIVDRLAQTGRDLSYLLTGFPIALAAFVISVTLVPLSLGLLVVWVGIPVGIATLHVARGFAELERRRLREMTGTSAEGAYGTPPAGASRLRRLLFVFTDRQRWKDLLHSILLFPVATVTWSIALTWTAAVLSGLTSWIWDRYVPKGDEPQPEILDWLGSTRGHLTLGVFALLTLPWVVRGLTVMQAGLGRVLLDASPEARLRAEVERLESQRGAAAAAESTSLRRIERDLHDGPQQQLVRLQMDAAAAERALDAEPERARELLTAVREQSQETLAELRALTRGFAPPLLAERGLAAAVESLGERATVPVTVAASIDEPLGVASETAAYFVVSEALANVAKHAGASTATVRITTAEGSLEVAVEDDGRGGASLAKGHGLAGLADRVAGVGGTLAVTDADGGGTVVSASVPIR